jgi:hypothetical protein
MRTPGPWWMRKHHQQWREKLPLKLQTQSTDNKDDLLVLKSMLVLVQKKRCHFDLQLKLVGG